MQRHVSGKKQVGKRGVGNPGCRQRLQRWTLTSLGDHMLYDIFQHVPPLLSCTPKILQEMLKLLQDDWAFWPNMVFHLSPFFLGSRYQRDIPGKQEGGWPGEDIHHLQQGQGLAPPASSRRGPERKPSTLPAGQSPNLMGYVHRAGWWLRDATSGAFF